MVSKAEDLRFFFWGGAADKIVWYGASLGGPKTLNSLTAVALISFLG